MLGNDPERQINNGFDLLAVLATNGILFFVNNYATPLISLATAICSLYYIIRKIKKEFLD